LERCALRHPTVNHVWQPEPPTHRERKKVSEETYNVLFVCTGNSARSIMAEALLNARGRERFRAYSAGSHPKGEMHPLALELLAKNRVPSEGLRSKSWDEFAQPGAPNMDYVVTVCDNAAGEICPVWPGQPITAHWGIPDPAAAEGNDAEKRRAFQTAYAQLSARISLLIKLPLASLDRLSLQRKLDEIGTIRSEAPQA
jgi:arsenate reductase (thioredoxin)